MNRGASEDLLARREQLRLRSAQLREQIATRTQVLQPVFRATDRVRGGVRGVRQVRQGRAPYVLGLLALSALAGALLVRPRVATSLALRAWSGWQMYRRARPVVERVLRQWR
ncbi:MAG: hypothetical protein LCH72_06565 [Proteobacteria bacterium]|nr:hypothetical protein [Pseudomonadota bacterium]HQD16579.1 hypothetical protein [Ottowia sp.]